jgi:hypothetical protein
MYIQKYILTAVDRPKADKTTAYRGFDLKKYYKLK